MTINSYIESTSSGWGTFDTSLDIFNADIFFSVPNAVGATDFADLDFGFEPTDDVQTVDVSVFWRAKITITETDPLATKFFNVRSGQARFGSFIISSGGFITDTGFISFSRIMTPLYSFSFTYDVNARRIVSLNADKFPGQLPTFSVRNRAYKTSSFMSTGYLAQNGQDRSVNANCEAGDSFAAYLDSSVVATESSVAYAFSCTTLNADIQPEGFTQIIQL